MKRSSTILAVVSGKGGVGKSLVSVNLAEILCAEGHRVALVDADFGQGACAVLLNETPEATVLDHLHSGHPAGALYHRTASGLTLVQAVAEPGRAEAYRHRLYQRLDGLLEDLRAEHTYIVIDTPAGTEGPVRWALDRADLGLVVLVGEPTAVADAYRLVKSIWEKDPAYPLGLVVNFAEDEAEAQSIAERFGTITTHFTGQETMYLGGVPFSEAIRQSVRRQQPAVHDPGPVRDAFRSLARTLARGRHALLTTI